MRRTVEKASILILRQDFYAPQVRSPPAAVTECGRTCRLEELLSCNTFCDFLFKLLNICLINVLFANMFEDPVWCFLNMRREMKVGDSRCESADTFGRIENKQLQCSKSFPSN